MNILDQPRSEHCVIAIDGPSGSGKSSAAKGVARRLKLDYVDTGAMYRAVAVAYRDAQLTPADGIEVARRIREEWDLVLATDPDVKRTLVNGVDVTEIIRTPAVSALVSDVATMIPVRQELQRLQRSYIATTSKGIVMEGRDITTVVAPDADLRVLLVADPVARMKRRQQELGQPISEADLADQVLRRDRDDATVSQFDTPAPGVILVDSTHMDLTQVIDHLCELLVSNKTAK
ncbi:MAG: (d)CMP kinase [Propionibacteriaceae bacterium]